MINKIRQNNQSKMIGKWKLLFILCCSAYISSAQSNNEVSVDSLNPILIKKIDLSGVDLPKVKINGHPSRKFFQKKLYGGSELSVFILSSETAVNTFESFPIEEFVYFMNGKAIVSTESNKEINFFSGDFIVVPKGFAGKWTNIGANPFHLELSVISNKRFKKAINSTVKSPFAIDRAVLSGLQQTGGSNFSTTNKVYSGLELSIKIESEKPKEVALQNTEKEQFFHILNGMVIITANGISNTFYVGDFFILPKGFIGLWQSQAQGDFRSIIVEQSDS